MPQNILGILVGGGPAPGINGVISSATIEAINSKLRVIGFYDGFKWLMEEDLSHIKNLAIKDVSRIHMTGGSILRTSRESPLSKPEGMKKVIRSLKKTGITHLITIGGEGTATIASHLARQAAGVFRIVHVPKTIDNDLPLPEAISTFGFQTARHIGSSIVQNLMEDAKTTNRWYVVVTMGRRAGFLALGIGFAAGATLSVIPEEFPKGKVSLGEVCDVIEGAMLKRRWLGRSDWVAILAEGLAERIAVNGDLSLGKAQVDEFAHLRLSELDFGKAVKEELQRRFAARNQKIAIASKDIGYELRSADPIPFDVDYTRRLGYGAVQRLLAGKDRAVICYQGGALTPIPFEKILNPKTGRIKTRTVDIRSEYYQAAVSYMIRLKNEDFKDPYALKGLAHTAGLSSQQFLKRFYRTVR